MNRIIRRVGDLVIGIGAFSLLSIALSAQFGPPPAGPPKPPKVAAPIDLTGYWVSIVSEDWRFRMEGHEMRDSLPQHEERPVLTLILLANK